MSGCYRYQPCCVSEILDEGTFPNQTSSRSITGGQLNLNRTRGLAALILAAATLAAGQTKEFEVASVKPHNGEDDGRVGIQITPGGRWRATNVPLQLLLQIAYELKPGQMTGAPGWINNERYDIDAKLDETLGPNPKPGEMQPYLQSLLEKRFQLKFHRETKEMQVYALVVAKGGPKMKLADPAERGPSIRMGMGQLTMAKVDMDQFVRELSRQVGRPVLNQTELTGQYTMELTFAPEGGGGHGDGPPGERGPAPGGEGPTVFTAVQEQLGLRLDSKKAPVQMFVVDRIERPEAN